MIGKKQTKIWVVDDDEMIGNLVCDYLRVNTQYTPYYFQSVAKAKKSLWRVKPDLMLLDWIMPECSGLDFIEILKKKPKTAQIPIFMLTGLKSGKEFEEACESANLEGYITKPVDFKRLTKRLDFFFENDRKSA